MRTHGHGPYQRLRPVLLDPRAVVYKARPDGLSDAEKAVAKLEGTLAKQILAALQAQGDAIDIDSIIAALEQGDIAKVLALLDGAPATSALGAIEGAVQDGVYAAGAATAAAINLQLKGVQFEFRRLNPQLITWLQTYSLRLIREINDTTKEGVRGYLLAGMTEGKGPRAVAKEVKGIIGLTERQANAVKAFRKELESFHLRRSAAGWNLGKTPDKVNGTQVFRPDADGNPKDGVLERRLRDFRYDGQLKSALTSGKPLTAAQIDKMVAAYQRKYLAYRARTIARTEAVRTNAQGIQEAWRQAVETGKVSEDLVRRQWIVARDERLCEWCGPVPGMNPKLGVKLGQPFATGKGPVLTPPLHPNCRCTILIRAYEPKQLAAK